MPQKGLIGDLQIDKHDKKILFYDSNIDCSVDSCTVKCIVSEPAIDRLISTSPYKVDIEHIELLKMYNEGWINYRYRSSGHCTITFGNVELKELIVEKPHCSLKVGLSYACEACTEQPRATLISTHVQTEGMLSYESNCTWDRASLSCNIEMRMKKEADIIPDVRNQNKDIVPDSPEPSTSRSSMFNNTQSDFYLNKTTGDDSTLKTMFENIASQKSKS
ncbi:hypothetical protein ACJJTC_014813 [Scirpophaga incertulas]